MYKKFFSNISYYYLAISISKYKSVNFIDKSNGIHSKRLRGEIQHSHEGQSAFVPTTLYFQAKGQILIWQNSIEKLTSTSCLHGKLFIY